MPEHLRDYHYEVVVLGGGPAGIAAACVAAESGCRVALLESTPWLGGPLWRTLPDVPAPRPARFWLDRLSRSTVEVFDQTTAFAATNPDVVHAERGDEALHIGWNKLILATGAQELFLPFPGWTLPNVFGVGGLQLLAKTGWPAEGRRVVVAGSGPLAFAAAAYLARHGATVTDIVEQTTWGALTRFASGLPWLAPSKLVQAAGFKWQLMRTRFRAGRWVTAAEGRPRSWNGSRLRTASEPGSGNATIWPVPTDSCPICNGRGILAAPWNKNARGKTPSSSTRIRARRSRTFIVRGKWRASPASMPHWWPDRSLASPRPAMTLRQAIVSGSSPRATFRRRAGAARFVCDPNSSR